MRLRAMLTAALAVVAHLALLVAPATCACETVAAAAPAHECCCTPGGPVMPCSTKAPVASSRPDDGDCAARNASCTAEPPAAVTLDPGPGSLASVLAPAEFVILPAPRSAAPRPAFETDTGPAHVPLGVLLARCTVLLI